MKKLFIFCVVVLMYDGACSADDKITFDDITFGKGYKIKGVCVNQFVRI